MNLIMRSPDSPPSYVVHDNTSQYFLDYVADLTKQAQEANLADSEFLYHYVVQRKLYISSTRHINRLFAYMSQTWIKANGHKTGRGYPVNILALVAWHSNVSWVRKAANITQRMMMDERNAKDIDTELLGEFLQALLCIDFNFSSVPGTAAEGLKKICQDMYRQHFEDILSVEMEKYYRQTLSNLPSRDMHDMSTYVRDALSCIRRENVRHSPYWQQFPAETTAKMRRNFSHVFVDECQEKLISYYQILREKGNSEELRLLFNLIGHSPEVIQALLPMAGEYFTTVFQSVGETLAGQHRDQQVSTALYVSTYVNLFADAYRGLSSSHGVPECIVVLDRSAKEFVNGRTLAGEATQLSPDMLVAHMDVLLRKGGTSKEGLQGALEVAALLFAFLNDKDVFQEHYRVRLAERLLSGTYGSQDTELYMVGKLEEVCGSEFCRKPRQMIADISNGEELTNQFNDQVKERGLQGIVPFSVLVVSHCIWPSLSSPSNSFVIPVELAPTYKAFDNFFNGRKLTCLWHYSDNQIQANCFEQKPILYTNSWQTAVLLQYNDHDALSLAQLLTATGITEDVLAQTLVSLTEAGILTKGDGGNYDLNFGYKHRKTQVSLRAAIKVELDNAALESSVQENREMLMQATIVRVMKTEQTLLEKALIQEVVTDISNRYSPVVSDIKKAIEALLEKEYIVRKDGAEDQLTYVV